MSTRIETKLNDDVAAKLDEEMSKRGGSLKILLMICSALASISTVVLPRHSP